ncbi:hypothetical protein M9H77_19641 [Catharanthus roseus]|uniref:Uncharacterized protein n=1 Tax=Catharanthus roseus TaxID=4058 RepID=A0ACC0BB61_CATRO|nr:hypothetical protein M9H77_19641 [Catharanthus roseus]
MEFEDREEHEGDIEMGPSYDSLGNSNSITRTPKIPSPVSAAAVVVDPQSHRKPKYRECLKNHAVGIGGHAVDGCGEFLPAGAEGTLDSLKCAACNCHRNFHRKETNGGHFHQPLLTHHPHGAHFSPFYRPPPPSGYLQIASHNPRPAPLALPSTSGGGGSRDIIMEQEDMNSGGGGGVGGMSSKKRFRTKFTQEQKEKMVELAERVGWRIQKQDEEIVEQLCNEIGIRRHVLKVWMHNNKHTLGLGKKP